MTTPSYAVRLEPGGETFAVRPEENILDAALRFGIGLKYGCRHGNCSSCKYLVTDGDVDPGAASPYSLSERERDEGWALLCCATPLEDLRILDDRPLDSRRLPVLTPQVHRAEVLAVERLTATLRGLRLRTEQAFAFYPGQFVEIGVPGRPGQWRAYSVASPPSAAPELGFVVKRIEGGTFSGALDTLPAGTPLEVRGPYGSSYLRAGSAPVLLVATGSGVAPVLEHAAEQADPRSFTFFYGARDVADLPFDNQLAALAGRIDLTYRPVLSRPSAADVPAQRVTTAILRGIDDGTPYDAYLCGNPEMCDAVGALLEAKGTAEEAIFADRFFPAVRA